MSSTGFSGKVNFIWSVADLLRGDYKPAEYGRVILPLVVIRRLDCVLEPTKDKVLKKAASTKGAAEMVEKVLAHEAGEQFFNTSKLSFRKLVDDPNNIAANLRSYIAGFSQNARDIIDNFGFDTQVARLDKANLLYLVIGKFLEIDLHPDAVANTEMGYIYEELVRRFSEQSNETAGEYFTPREVIRLMVNLLFIEDDDALRRAGAVRTLYDPACGTGGMLSVAEDHLRALNPAARLEVFGQELNPETYAVCRSDMMLKGQDASHIMLGNSFTEDGLEDWRFDYMLANPPFGVDWKKVEAEIRAEAEDLGFKGRFGAGLPRIDDGALLFLQHMMSKMKARSEGGSRLAIVFNGSPLFSGAAGSQVSEIRRWIIENDLLEAVVALPDQLFYNTGIFTYFWIVTNRKSEERKGKVQLLDARAFWVKMRKSLGDKRKRISDEQIEEITRLYGEFVDGQAVKIFDNEAFGFMRITVDRPKRTRYVVDRDVLATASSLLELQTAGPEALSFVEDLLSGWMGMDFDDSPDTKELQPYKKLWTYLSQPATGGRPELAPLDVTLAKKIAKKIQQAALRRDEDWPIITNAKGAPEPDPDLRDSENVPIPHANARWVEDPSERLGTSEYRAAIENFMRSEVLPQVPDAWVDHSKTKIGYEIPLTRHFFKYLPPRPLAEIDADIRLLEEEIQVLLGEVAE